MIRVSVSHLPEWEIAREWRHSWSDTVDEGRLMVQMALADPTIEGIHYELHGGQPNPTHRNYLGYESADEQRHELADQGYYDTEGEGA